MTSKRAIYQLEALKNWFKEDSEQYIAIDKAIEALQHVESVGEKTDCVEVVRCKDCKWCVEHYDIKWSVPYWVCVNWDCSIDADGFCYEGERKEE